VIALGRRRVRGDRRRGGPVALLAAAAVTAGSLLAPVVQASGTTAWWRSGPRLAATAIAATSATTTLVLARTGTYWVTPGTGRVRRVPLGSPAAAIAVTGAGAGVAALADGEVQMVALGGLGTTLATLSTPVRALAAIGSAADPIVVVATAGGLVVLRPGRVAARVEAGAATAVVAPPAPGLPWWALVGGRLYGSRTGTAWARARHVPALPLATRVLAELGDGTLLAAEPSGLVLASAGHGLTPDLQVLPAGGLAGVPGSTGIAAVGPTSAYLATLGFAALLTPDDGYDWYRAAPSQLPADIAAIASVGPVFAGANPQGEVVAAGPRRLYLHRLQSLPAPPIYTGGTAMLEGAGTVATTVAAILVGLCGLAIVGRRRGRRRLGRPV